MYMIYFIFANSDEMKECNPLLPSYCVSLSAPQHIGLAHKLCKKVMYDCRSPCNQQRTGHPQQCICVVCPALVTNQPQCPAVATSWSPQKRSDNNNSNVCNRRSQNNWSQTNDCCTMRRCCDNTKVQCGYTQQNNCNNVPEDNMKCIKRVQCNCQSNAEKNGPSITCSNPKPVDENIIVSRAAHGTEKNSTPLESPSKVAEEPDASLLNLESIDDPIDTIIASAAEALHMDPVEHTALKLVIFDNYVRNYDTLLEAIKEGCLSEMVHPLISDTIVKSCNEYEQKLASCLEKTSHRLKNRSVENNNNGSLQVIVCAPIRAQIVKMLFSINLDNDMLDATTETILRKISAILGVPECVLRVFVCNTPLSLEDKVFHQALNFCNNDTEVVTDNEVEITEENKSSSCIVQWPLVVVNPWFQESLNAFNAHRLKSLLSIQTEDLIMLKGNTVEAMMSGVSKQEELMRGGLDKVTSIPTMQNMSNVACHR